MTKYRMFLAFAALLLPMSAAAQTPVTFCDSTLPTANWSLSVFTTGTGSNPGTVTAANPSTGGDPTLGTAAGCTAANSSFRSVLDLTPAYAGTEGLVWGVHIYTPGSYNPASAPIATVQVSLAYECLNATGAPCTSGSGQAFGPAITQGGNHYIALPYTATGVAGGWKPLYTSAPLTSADFCMISPTGSTTPCVSPDFSANGEPVQCGFYEGNGSKGGSYKVLAGYDNWSCTITPEPAGVLKICKVAGSGTIVGTPVTFAYSSTAGSGSLTVPAGAGPGGYCALAPIFAQGTDVTIKETIPPASSVMSIDVAPITQEVGSPNLGTGTVTVKIGAGVTEATYTDETKRQETGYLEICKKYVNADGGTLTGNFGFTVSPGVPIPIVIPAGACSGPIEVQAGTVTIKEVSSTTSSMTACSTLPAGRQGACSLSAETSTVTVPAANPPGNIENQTIAFITNGQKPVCTNCTVADPSDPNQ